MQISLHVLLWNDVRYLPDFFASLKKQTYGDLLVRLLDNGSADGSGAYAQEHFPEHLVARNVKNLGFAGGHNQLIRFALERWGDEDLSQKAIVVANPDMILEPRLVEELARVLEAHPELGAVQPKIYRAFADGYADDEVARPQLSHVLDTTGLVLGRAWRLEDRGAGSVDTGQYDNKIDLVGPAGAFVMYRASALKDVMVMGEVFDEDFFTYREDCDLALRLRRAGHRTLFVPTATAHHYRGMYGAQKRTLWQRLQDRRKQRPFFAALSSRNQLLLLVKNLSCFDFLLAAPWIVVGEGLRTAYGLLFEPQTRKVLLASLPLVLKMLKKRKEIFAKARVKGEVVRAYVGV